MALWTHWTHWTQVEDAALVSIGCMWALASIGHEAFKRSRLQRDGEYRKGMNEISLGHTGGLFAQTHTAKADCAPSSWALGQSPNNESTFLMVSVDCGWFSPHGAGT